MMELVTIKIELNAAVPVQIRRSEVSRVSKGYVYPMEGVAVRKKRLFTAITIYPGTLGVYSLTSGGDYATDDEIRQGVDELLTVLDRQRQACGEMSDRLWEEWMGRVNE